jgi:hypothetical protein
VSDLLKRLSKLEQKVKQLGGSVMMPLGAGAGAPSNATPDIDVGVTKIIAGEGVIVSPTTGVGQVTVSAPPLKIVHLNDRSITYRISDKTNIIIGDPEDVSPNPDLNVFNIILPTGLPQTREGHTITAVAGPHKIQIILEGYEMHLKDRLVNLYFSRTFMYIYPNWWRGCDCYAITRFNPGWGIPGFVDEMGDGEAYVACDPRLVRLYGDNEIYTLERHIQVIIGCIDKEHRIVIHPTDQVADGGILTVIAQYEKITIVQEDGSPVDARAIANIDTVGAVIPSGSVRMFVWNADPGQWYGLEVGK